VRCNGSNGSPTHYRSLHGGFTSTFLAYQTLLTLIIINIIKYQLDYLKNIYSSHCKKHHDLVTWEDQLVVLSPVPRYASSLKKRKSRIIYFPCLTASYSAYVSYLWHKPLTRSTKFWWFSVCMPRQHGRQIDFTHWSRIDESEKRWQKKSKCLQDERDNKDVTHFLSVVLFHSNLYIYIYIISIMGQRKA
jgi:hypothetical protein